MSATPGSTAMAGPMPSQSLIPGLSVERVVSDDVHVQETVTRRTT